ncbi:hypothetical protein [Sphingobium sp. EP60837]|uniref:hypothetical protein n=1 Tax=Sphingobium sp. EP60837 TaxID=1855519 RepID=UPI0007DDBD9C|nr:hypothetical protein [Sphingobium sp. EP60837]ANI79035.1 hypothetical protein EP837_02640 [Sphingobium sp. EP60837]
MIDLTDRERIVLTYIRRRQGEHISGVTDSRICGLTQTTFNRTVSMLRAKGAIKLGGNHNFRTMTVLEEPTQEPARVESYTCPRCGARNCAEHSAGVLTTSARIPAWRAYA